MLKYGILFEKIYSEDEILFYKTIGVIKGNINDTYNLFYDESDSPYMKIDDIGMIQSDVNYAVGYVESLENIRKEFPEMTADKEILSTYYSTKAENIYLGKIMDNDPYIQIIPLNLDFLTTLDDANKIFECMNVSINSSNKILDDKTIDSLLKLQTKDELKSELKKIKINGTVEIPEVKIKEKEEITKKQNEPIIKQDGTTKINSNELYDILSHRIINQESAIRDVVSTLAIDQFSTCTAERTRCLLVGPTGCGKSEIIRTVANYIGGPFVHIDCTQLTVEGYVGGDIDNFLERLIVQANGDIEKAQHGIVVLDEIDKKGSPKRGDVSGRDVLDMLLQFLDGTDYPIKEDGFLGKTKFFNTSNLTIFAAGAFTDVLREKMKINNEIGFNGKKVSLKSTLDLKPEDFVKYGMMTDEFMGRFPVLVELNALDEDSLEKILLTSTASPLKAEIRKLKNLGVELTYEDGYIHAVAKHAVLLKTGARSLKSIIEKSIKEARFEVIMNSDKYNRIELLKESVTNPKAYKLYKKEGC